MGAEVAEITGRGRLYLAIRSVSARRADGRRTWTLDIAVNGASVATTSLTDPLDKAAHSAVRWYMNEYTQISPYSVAEAKAARKRLQGYAGDVVRQLGLVAIIEAALKGRRLEATYLDISDGASLKPADTIQRLHWELLEDPQVWDGTLGVPQIVVTRKSAGAPAVQSGLPPWPRTNSDGETRAINILLVVSRDLGRNAAVYSDISPAMARTVITAARRKQQSLRNGIQVNLEMVRPGTFAALADHLARCSGRFDLVHFDLHGEVQKRQASLSFNSPDDDGLVEVPVRDVARLLEQHRISCVMLNSCESARADAGGSDANMAEVFLAHGVRDVIAAPFKMSSSAAEKLLPEFYQKLLAENGTLSAATFACRRAMQMSPRRSARFDLERDMLDWFNLVHYSSHKGPREDEIVHGSSGIPAVIAEQLLPQAIVGTDSSIVQPHETVQAVVGPAVQLVGRDFDLVRLENLVVKEPVVLLHGAAGVGKSALLDHARQVWAETDFADVLVNIDFSRAENSLVEKILDRIMAAFDIKQPVDDDDAWKQISEHLSQRRVVIFFDSLDSAFTLTGSPRNKAEGAMELLKRLVELAASVASSSCRLVFVDCRPAIANSILSEGVGVEFKPGVNVYQLNGLNLPDAIELSQGVLKDVGVDTCSWRKPELDQLELALGALQRIPAAMKHVLPVIKSKDVQPTGFYDFLLFHIHQTPRDAFPSSMNKLTHQLDVLARDGLGSAYFSCLMALGSYWSEAPPLSVFSETIATTLGLNFEVATATYQLATDRGWIFFEESDDLDLRIHPLLTLYARNPDFWNKPGSSEIPNHFPDPPDHYEPISKEDMAGLIRAVTEPRSASTSTSTPMLASEKAAEFRKAYIHAMETESTSEVFARVTNGYDYKKTATTFPRRLSNLFCAINICLSASDYLELEDWPWLHFAHGSSSVRMVCSIAEMAVSAQKYEALLHHALNKIGGHAIPEKLLGCVLMIVIYLSGTHLSDIKAENNREKARQLAELALDIVKASEGKYGPTKSPTTTYLRGVALRHRMIIALYDHDIPTIREYGQLSDKNDDEYLRLAERWSRSLEETKPEHRPEALANIWPKLADNSIQRAYIEYRKEVQPQLDEAFIHQIQNVTRYRELLEPLKAAFGQQSFGMRHIFLELRRCGFTGLENQVRWWPEGLDVSAFAQRFDNPRLRLNEIEDASDTGRVADAAAHHKELMFEAILCGDFSTATEHSSAAMAMYAGDPSLADLLNDHRKHHSVLTAMVQWQDAQETLADDPTASPSTQAVVQASSHVMAELRAAGSSDTILSLHEIEARFRETIMARNGGLLLVSEDGLARNKQFLKDCIQLILGNARDAVGFGERLAEFALKVQSLTETVHKAWSAGQFEAAAQSLDEQIALLETAEMGAPFRNLLDLDAMRRDRKVLGLETRRDEALTAWGELFEAHAYEAARAQLREADGLAAQIAAIRPPAVAATAAAEDDNDDNDGGGSSGESSSLASAWELTERCHLRELMTAALADNGAARIKQYESILARHDAGDFRHVAEADREAALDTVRFNLLLRRAQEAYHNEEFETGAALFAACLAFDDNDGDESDDKAEQAKRAAGLHDMRNACVYLFHSRRLYEMDLALEYGSEADRHIAALAELVARREKEKRDSHGRGITGAANRDICPDFTRDMLNYARFSLLWKRSLMARFGEDGGKEMIRESREQYGTRNPYEGLL